MLKYILNENDTIKVNGRILKNVVYTDEFLNDIFYQGFNVKYGEVLFEKSNCFSAYIESYDNLSQEGHCLIYGETKIYQDALISDEARVGNSIIYGSAKVYNDAYVEYSTLYGNVKIYNEAEVFSTICKSDARIYGKANLRDCYIESNPRLFGCLALCSCAIKSNYWLYKDLSACYIEYEYEGVESEDCFKNGVLCKYYSQCHFD